MENKYRYSGEVDIDEVMFNLYSEQILYGKKISSGSTSLKRALQLHNQGYSPGGICKIINKERENSGETSRVSSQQVKNWLTRAKVKPNESPNSKHGKEGFNYKLLDRAFHRQVAIKQIGGKPLMDILKEDYNGIVTFADGTTACVDSFYIFDRLMKMAGDVYIKKEQ